MDNQISIFITTINSDNICSEKQIKLEDFIFSDNNIAENILESKDKYKFLLKNLVIDNTVISFIIKIIKDKTIIYNQLFDFSKITGEIKTKTSHTIMTYEIKDSFLFFTRFWIYTYKNLESVVVPEVPTVAPVDVPVVAPVDVPVVAPLDVLVVAPVDVLVVAPVDVPVVAPVDVPVVEPVDVNEVQPVIIAEVAPVVQQEKIAN